jgi:hypothetical protein
MIPGSDWWMVIKRHARDTKSRGTCISRKGLTEKEAREIAFSHKQKDIDNNYWAIDEREY